MRLSLALFHVKRGICVLELIGYGHATSYCGTGIVLAGVPIDKLNLCAIMVSMILNSTLFSWIIFVPAGRIGQCKEGTIEF